MVKTDFAVTKALRKQTNIGTFRERGILLVTVKGKRYVIKQVVIEMWRVEVGGTTYELEDQVPRAGKHARYPTS